MTQITVETLKARLDKGEKVIMVDVREDYERLDFNIGGLHHRLGFIQSMQIEPLEAFKEQELVLYCRSGNRSQVAGLVLETMGFRNVVNLAGGMNDWKEKFGS